MAPGRTWKTNAYRGGPSREAQLPSRAHTQPLPDWLLPGKSLGDIMAAQNAASQSAALSDYRTGSVLPDAYHNPDAASQPPSLAWLNHRPSREFGVAGPLHPPPPHPPQDRMYFNPNYPEADAELAPFAIATPSGSKCTTPQRTPRHGQGEHYAALQRLENRPLDRSNCSYSEQQYHVPFPTLAHSSNTSMPEYNNVNDGFDPSWCPPNSIWNSTSPYLTSTPVVSSKSTGPLSEESVPSKGSALHSWGVCKPCAFVVKGSCVNGEDCRFCHLCEPGEKKRRKKERLAMRRDQRDLTRGRRGRHEVEDPQIHF